MYKSFRNLSARSRRKYAKRILRPSRPVNIENEVSNQEQIQDNANDLSNIESPRVHFQEREREMIVEELNEIGRNVGNSENIQQVQEGIRWNQNEAEGIRSNSENNTHENDEENVENTEAEEDEESEESNNEEDSEESNSEEDDEESEESHGEDDNDDNHELNEDRQSENLEHDEDQQTENDEYEFYRDEPLYTNASLTVSQSMLLIATLFLKHNLTQTCLADIICIINMHCPSNDLFMNSLHKFKDFFDFNNNNKIIRRRKHYYCSSCLKKLRSSRDNCDQCVSSKSSYFITMSICQQLKEMYKRSKFVEILQKKSQRPEFSTINDLYDGNLYKNTGAFLKNSNNISLTWYADGVPVFKSSQISMWPIYFSINELPPRERIKRENLLLAGLWFGNKKPEPNMFFYELYPQLKNLWNGLNIKLDNGLIRLVKGVLLLGTCDLPAKAEFMNFKYFSGYFGCPSCTLKGDQVGTIGGGHTQVFKYTRNLPLRTSVQSKEHASLALNTGIPQMGVKGPCILATLMPDFIRGIAIDKMHCVDNGVVKKLLSLWFESDNSSSPFSLFHVKEVINERLQAIKPPKIVHRMPRKIEELVHWKASELRLWFFYYSLPVLNGIMRQDYFQHYLLLVIAISYLNTDNITSDMIIKAENLLHKFVREFEVLYNERYCSINIHMLLHLPKCTEDIGPLWASSCYQYENLNGQLLKTIHGTGHIESQISNTHGQLLAMQRHLDRLPEGPIRNFCINRKYGVKINEKINDSCYSVGQYSSFNTEIPLPVQQALRHLPSIRQIKKYQRLLKDRQLYICKNYKRTLQTDSTNVIYSDCSGQPAFGTILFFVKIWNCECTNICECISYHFAIVQNYNYTYSFQAQGDNEVNCIVPYLYKFRVTENYVAVPISSLSSVCFLMKNENDFFVAVPINSYEDE